MLKKHLPKPIPRKDFLKMLEKASQMDTLQGKWTDKINRGL
ncbi:hypothetical protein [Draconibacterium sediminis]|nr:hypothetical protein [Draconibacterium sediminis]